MFVIAASRQEQTEYVFGILFIMAQRLQSTGNAYLKEAGLTTKQWLLLVVVVKLFKNPPTLSEAAIQMGSSRQNVKQIAAKLQQRGFLDIYPDPNDRRTLRLWVTEKSNRFWQARGEQDARFIQSLFSGLSDTQVSALFEALYELEKGSDRLLKNEV